MKKIFLKLFAYAPLVFAAFTLFTLGACKKEKSPVEVPTTSELICGNYWQLYSMPIEPPLDLIGGVKLTDYFTQTLNDCDKDNYVKYRDNNNLKTYVNYAGILKCDPLDKDSTIGVWSLSADGKIIEQDGEKLKLILIDNKNMHIQMDNFMLNSSITFKFKKKI
ncbi:MAG: hypothetical protein CK532_02570 [Flavobacteriales bacterium]|nr:MAG: hypothetical protein CK532_02570 [Flavobacteriales bacterium]